ncbi:cobalamin/Fe3+-siderophores ABC transporter ATP-binding protein [Aminobacter sp. DSM 101952]|uniref:ABC transporter ATP-binding protein n=1 Tax=Aminobacter sp. DSM 101952 TaxID=2735891 RepID=UPI0006FB0EEE|nr:ABC transporter ATP-binding protein [Aminobacter sp. DSM 101952]KQU64960.1 cobalamin/Fe3+-siderophores ABC transporter ATP-binding protein [Aminobacter sp. DSM 101952]
MSDYLSVDKVSFGYGSRPVLREVSVALSKGHILGLIGPNGAGKSTLVRIVLGLSSPSSGRVLLDGKDIRDLTPKARARRIAYVPQSSPLSFPATVFETCLLGRTPHMGASPSANDLAVVEELLCRLRLEDFAFRLMSELSGGERQRVMLARALAQETDVLVLDEPTSALDIGNQLFTLRVVSEIARERGVTALVAIHDLSLAARFSDSLLLLDKGVVVGHGNWQSTLTETTVRDVYGVNVEIGLLRDIPVFAPHELT